jgi:hypothetical protein
MQAAFKSDISDIAYRRSEKLVGNQFLIAAYAPPCQKGRRRPLFENFSLRALLRDCT